jgi:excisionase family DNA binding protein
MEILTAKEACIFLKISERTLRRWIKEGLPRSQVKKGSKLLFSKKKLLEWLDENQEPLPVHLTLQKLKLIRRR